MSENIIRQAGKNLIKKGMNGDFRAIEWFSTAVNRCLIDKGLGEKRSAVIRRNLIDITDFDMESIIQLEDLKETAPDFYTNWLRIIPPFEHGTIKMSKRNDTTEIYNPTCRYITWDIIDINLDERTIKIFLHEYFFDANRWMIGFSQEQTLHILDLADQPCGFAVKADTTPINTYVNDVKDLTIDELLSYTPSSLSKDEQLEITSMYIDREYLYKNMYDTVPYIVDNIKNDFKFVIQFFGIFNCLLYLSRGKTHTSKKKAPHPVTTEYAPEDTRHVRTINSITITSETPPRIHTQQSIRRYKCASWTVRAHTRTYTNGRTILIREHTNTRHNMNESKLARTQKIKLK